MKNILIGIYIIAVLLISAFARASQITIHSSNFNSKSNILKVNGYYNGICLKHVRPSLKVEQFNNGLPDYKLNLLADEICPPQVRNYKFEMAIDSRTLGLPENEILVLNFNHPVQKRTTNPILINNKYSYSLDFSKLNLINGRVIRFEGSNQKPIYAVQTSNDEIFVLKGPFDFSNYLDQNVSLKGYELKIQIQPINEKLFSSSIETDLSDVSIGLSSLKNFNVVTIFSLN